MDLIQLYITIAAIGCTSVGASISYNYDSPQPPHWNGYNSFSDSGPYTPVPIGPQTSEGYYVDPNILEKIKHIILKDEINNGPREYNEEDSRVVGIELLGIHQSIELAQYHQSNEGYGAKDYSSYDNQDDFSNRQSDYSVPALTYPSSSDYSSSTYDNPNRTTSYDVPIESTDESVSSSSSDFDSALSYSNSPEPSGYSPIHNYVSYDNHNLHNAPTAFHGSSFSSPPDHGSPPSSYEKPPSINVRTARRTQFYNNPHRTIFPRYH